MRSQNTKTNTLRRIRSDPNSFNDIITNVRGWNEPEHNRNQKAVIIGKGPAKKEQRRLFKRINKIIDRGSIKHGSNHRKYRHDRKFILKKFKKKNEKLIAHVHLLGDFCQDIGRLIIKKVGQEFKENNRRPSYYMRFKNGQWGWDIHESAIKKLVKNCSRNFLVSFENKNRIKK